MSTATCFIFGKGIRGHKVGKYPHGSSQLCVKLLRDCLRHMLQSSTKANHCSFKTEGLPLQDYFHNLFHWAIIWLSVNLNRKKSQHMKAQTCCYHWLIRSVGHNSVFLKLALHLILLISETENDLLRVFWMLRFLVLFSRMSENDWFAQPFCASFLCVCKCDLQLWP